MASSCDAIDAGKAAIKTSLTLSGSKVLWLIATPETAQAASRPALINRSSQAASTPWVYITHTAAISNCSAFGTGYDLISNPQWMTIGAFGIKKHN